MKKKPIPLWIILGFMLLEAAGIFWCLWAIVRNVKHALGVD